MEALRRERHPLVALAAVAFCVRLCLVILATALLPDGGAAAGWASLCQPSSQQDVPQSHNTLVCQCGTTCAHGCGLTPGLCGATPPPEPALMACGPKIRAGGTEVHHTLSPGSLTIRAPPSTLI